MRERHKRKDEGGKNNNEGTENAVVVLDVAFSPYLGNEASPKDSGGKKRQAAKILTALEIYCLHGEVRREKINACEHKELRRQLPSLVFFCEWLFHRESMKHYSLLESSTGIRTYVHLV